LGSNKTKGLIFPNFEGRFPSQSRKKDKKGRETLLGLDKAARFEGGFFLPSEVREGTIILDEQEQMGSRLWQGCHRRREISSGGQD
jgi:hypothetical protein